MRCRRLAAGGVALGAALVGVAQAPLGALAEDPGARGVVPKAGKWKGIARDVDGKGYPLTFRVVRTGKRLEVRDLVTKGTSVCARRDGSQSRDVVPLKMSRALVRTRGELRGIWVYSRNGADADGKFRPSTRMTGAFRVPPPDESCNGTTVFLRARLAAPARR